MRLDHPKFKNEHCQACIKKQFDKYGKFDMRCNGITVEQDVKFAVEEGGLSEEEARYIYDPAYFFEASFGSPARDYQIPILNCTSKNLVSRQCRQTGKTLALTNKILHYVGTNDNATVLIITPQEKQIKKIWDEYIFRDGIEKNDKLSVKRKREKPFYQVEFDNGSKIMLMIAGPGARGQTADWIYIDEAAIINNEMIKDILMTIASRGDDATILLTSTPMGRGNIFYESCKEDSAFQEFHVSIDDVPEMHSMIPRFKKLLGETGYIQEAMAEFPATSGGPFNLNGIVMAKTDYEYEDSTRVPGMIYFGGVDWNGPGIGTYFYIVGFDPSTYKMKIVDKAVVASANWNATVAKQTLIDLNRKWEPKHWMCDYGFSQSIVEELRLYSMRIKAPKGHPDLAIKHIIETVAFGSFMLVEDPFTKQEEKKTARSFIVSQVARLFEPQGSEGEQFVPLQFSAHDEELIRSLEVYKLLQITNTGQERYGIDKKDGVEDHAIDAFILACYGVIKYYNELFRKIIYASVGFNAQALLVPPPEDSSTEKVVAGGIVLLTDNSPEMIYLDEKVIKDPTESKDILISRSFSKGMNKRGYAQRSFSGIMKNRGGLVKRSNF